MRDEQGEWLRDYVDGQDIVAWITQGRESSIRYSPIRDDIFALFGDGACVDLIKYCPACGAEPEFVQEYWVAADRHIVCWCAACDLMCTVALGALVGTEPDHWAGP